jgi:hypothetical protein
MSYDDKNTAIQQTHEKIKQQFKRTCALRETIILKRSGKGRQAGRLAGWPLAVVSGIQIAEYDRSSLFIQRICMEGRQCIVRTL